MKFAGNACHHLGIRRGHAAGRAGARPPDRGGGPGDFIAEIGELSGRPALVNARATSDVETLLIATEALRAVLIAEAELGERINACPHPAPC